MRFSLFTLALSATAVMGAATPSTLDTTSNLVERQQHPGPGKSGALYKLLGAKLYHEISLAVHAVGISVAHTEQELNQAVTALDPSLGDALHQLLSVVDTLEADLVSLGFNT